MYICLLPLPLARSANPVTLTLQVYLGECFGTECAVKVVLGTTRNEQAAFLKEIRLLEPLQTELITRYLGYAVVRDGLVILSEYMPGAIPYLTPSPCIPSIRLSLCQRNEQNKGAAILRVDLSTSGRPEGFLDWTPRHAWMSLVPCWSCDENIDVHALSVGGTLWKALSADESEYQWYRRWVLDLDCSSLQFDILSQAGGMFAYCVEKPQQEYITSWMHSQRSHLDGGGQRLWTQVCL